MLSELGKALFIPQRTGIKPGWSWPPILHFSDGLPSVAKLPLLLPSLQPPGNHAPSHVWARPGFHPKNRNYSLHRTVPPSQIQKTPLSCRRANYKTDCFLDNEEYWLYTREKSEQPFSIPTCVSVHCSCALWQAVAVPGLPLHLAPEEPKHAACSDVHSYLTTLCRISLACHSVYSTPTALF